MSNNPNNTVSAGLNGQERIAYFPTHGSPNLRLLASQVEVSLLTIAAQLSPDQTFPFAT